MATPLVPARTRRTQAERTMATQRKLIDGAIDLLKKKRYTSFRTADVAEHAGVSKGAQTHHFPSKDMLVLQALEEVYRRTQQRALERIAVGRSAPDTLLEQLVADSREFFLGDDFLLSLDLMMVDPSSTLGSDVKRLAQLYRLPVEQAWLDALVAAGHPQRQAKDVVRLTFAIARGFGVRQLIAGQDEEFQHLMDSWMRMAKAMLLLSSAPDASGISSRRSLDKPQRKARKKNSA
jgi:AcrR family transcriptional regulator